MSTLSVLALTLAPLGILSYVVIRRMSAYNVNEAQVRLCHQITYTGDVDFKSSFFDYCLPVLTFIPD